MFVLANTFGSNDGQTLRSQDLNNIHVALTRSSGELFVFYTGAMPAAFDQIPVALYESSLATRAMNADEMGLN